MRARLRQRRLHMLSQEDAPVSSAGTRVGRTPSREDSRRRETGDGRMDIDGEGGGGGERGARSLGRVPWHLLDELDAEKNKLRVSMVLYVLDE